jgi:hypothetical protein
MTNAARARATANTGVLRRCAQHDDFRAFVCAWSGLDFLFSQLLQYLDAAVRDGLAVAYAYDLDVTNV